MSFHQSSIRLYHTRIRPAIDRQLTPEVYIIAALLVSSALLFALLTIASEVLAGSAAAYDWAIVLSLRNPADLSDPIGSELFEFILTELSTLGGAPVLAVTTLVAVGYFLTARKRDAALLLIAAVGGVAVLNTALKLLVARPGFNLGMMKFDTSTFSFPSGHAALSATTFLTLAALTVRAEPKPHVRSYILIVATALTLFIGSIRIYQGVHYPSDVLAGWTLGAAWALLCLLASAVYAQD